MLCNHEPYKVFLEPDVCAATVTIQVWMWQRTPLNMI